VSPFDAVLLAAFGVAEGARADRFEGVEVVLRSMVGAVLLVVVVELVVVGEWGLDWWWWWWWGCSSSLVWLATKAAMY